MFELVRPTRVEEALRLLSDGPPGSTMALAGGTDLVNAVEGGRKAPVRVVSLAKLPWRHLERRGSVLAIGSLLPLRDLELDASVRREAPLLVEACRDVGSVQLRHRATLGGNLGRAAATSDLIPPLLALEASVVVVGLGGERTLPLDGFALGSWTTVMAEGELIKEVLVPLPARGRYLWQRVRPSNDISQVGIAVAPPRSPGAGWHLAAGGVEPSPQRLRAAEGHLRSDRPTPSEIKAASEAASAEVAFRTDPRASETYRRHLLGVLLRRAVESLMAPAKGET